MSFYVKKIDNIMENTKAQKLFIPKTIHVGFQERKNTFDGKLAYVIYEDEKGRLRKETSWNNWRDHKIEPLVLENKPAKFVLNKSIHHYSNWSWSSSSGHHMMRMYDTRGIEVEITPENLVGILMHSNVSMRDFEQEMVYAWDGKELVLLPVNSTDYQTSVQFTNEQDVKLSTKNLKVGQIYRQKKGNTQYVYLGFYEKYDLIEPHKVNALKDIVYSDEYPFNFKTDYYRGTIKAPICNGTGFISKGNKHVFLCLDYQNLYQDKYQTISPSNLIPIAEMMMENYQTEITDFLNSFYHKGFQNQNFDFIQEKTFINLKEYPPLYDDFFKKDGGENPQMRNHYIKVNEKYYVLESILYEIANISFINETNKKWNDKNDKYFSWCAISYGKYAKNISFKNMKNQDLIPKPYKELVVFFCENENKKIESDKIYYQEKDGFSDILFNQIKQSLVNLLDKTIIKELVNDDVVQKIIDIKMNSIKEYFKKEYNASLYQLKEKSFKEVQKLLSEIEFDVYVLDKDKL